MPTTNATFRSGLSEEQIQSITDLVQDKPEAQWTPTDWANYNWATQGSGGGSLSSFLDTPTTDEITAGTGADTTISGTTSAWDDYFQSTAATALTSTEQGLASYYSQQEKEAAAEIATAETGREAALLGLETAYKAPSGEELLKGFMGEYKIEEKIAKLTEFQTQLAQLEKDYATVKSQIGAKPINAAIIRGQQFLKKEEFAADATFISSKASIVKDELDAAKDIVSSYYDAAMADRQSEINRYTNLYNLHDKNLITLNAEEKDAIDNQIKLMKDIESRQKEDKDKMLSLLVEYPGAWEKADIDLTKSLDENLKVMLPYMYQENMRREQLSRARAAGGAKKEFATAEEENTYNTAYNLYLREQAGQITPETWWETVEAFAEANNMDTSMADNLLKNQMTAIQQEKGVAGKPYYGEGGYDDDDVGSDVSGFGTALDPLIKGYEDQPNWLRYGSAPLRYGAYGISRGIYEGLDWLWGSEK